MTVGVGPFIQDVGNEKNNKNVPTRLPEGPTAFRERFIGMETVPLTRGWVDYLLTMRVACPQTV